MERFVREQMAFMGLAEADIETIRRTAPLVLKHEAALTEALYNHFLSFRETAEVAMTHGFVYYLLAIALSHSHREYGPGGKIPAEFMVGAMSLAQTAIAGVLRAELADPRE